MLDSSARFLIARQLLGLLNGSAIEDGRLEDIHAGLLGIAKFGASDAALRTQSNPGTDKGELLAAILEDAAIDPRQNPELALVCQTAIERKGLAALPELAQLARDTFDKRLDIADAVVHLAEPADPVDRPAYEQAWDHAKPGILAALSVRTGRANIRLTVKTDLSLISGARIHLGDQVIELSSRFELEKLRKSIRP